MQIIIRNKELRLFLEKHAINNPYVKVISDVKHKGWNRVFISYGSHAFSFPASNNGKQIPKGYYKISQIIRAGKAKLTLQTFTSSVFPLIEEIEDCTGKWYSMLSKQFTFAHDAMNPCITAFHLTKYFNQDPEYQFAFNQDFFKYLQTFGCTVYSHHTVTTNTLAVCPIMIRQGKLDMFIMPFHVMDKITNI